MMMYGQGKSEDTYFKVLEELLMTSNGKTLPMRKYAIFWESVKSQPLNVPMSKRSAVNEADSYGLKLVELIPML